MKVLARILTAILFLLLFLGAVVFAVLRDGTPPDPNDPLQSREDGITLARSQLERLFWKLDEQVALKKITKQRADELLRERASELADGLRTAGISRRQSFEYGEVLRTAGRWEEAAASFRDAIETAGDNEDRAVNARLRLAHCLAKMGQVAEAIRYARETFSASPGNKPPILMAVYLEIVPSVEFPDHEEELASLTRDAIYQHTQAVVFPETLPGQAFMNAKTHHLSNAWKLAISLAEKAGRSDLVAQYQRERDAMLSPTKGTWI